ncbi:MAG: DNA-directed RNA polymerase subunit delta [Mycoplasmataceae bacterium]|nr:DNA-directed RNA polymerase subunit delta [Mycoplasmataceae bacterium]
MARMQPIDIIYEAVKEKKNKPFTFDEVWKVLTKKGSGYKKEEPNLIGVVYTDLLQDSRFIYLGNKRWMLREYVSQREIANLQNALYDFNQEVTEEGFEKVAEEPNTDLPTKEIETGELDVEDEEVYEDIKTNISQKIDKDEEE